MAGIHNGVVGVGTGESAEEVTARREP
jgi:hypothetical protein